MRRRQAKLKPAYGIWYPGLTPDTWQDAMWVTEVVRRQLAAGEPRWMPIGRLLESQHFDFQGGSFEPYRGTERRTEVPHLPLGPTGQPTEIWEGDGGPQ